jgi:predicted esterase
VFTSALTIFLAAGSVVHAQDAGLVLRTSVTYNTQKATLQLTDDQRRQADALLREAQQANQAGKYGEAMRSLNHGLVVMRNAPWTPEVEFATALQTKLDHAMVEPGAKVGITFTTLYPCPGAKLRASVVLVPAKKNGGVEKSLSGPVAVEGSAAPVITRVDLPADAVGDYTIELRLAGGDKIPAPIVKNLPVHIERLGEQLGQLRAHLARAPKKDGLATAEYAVALYERADAGEVNPARVNFREEFASANAIVNALETARDPFAGKHGDSRRAYRSAVDNTLQPYRLFIPEAYDGSKPAPLVMALHGMGGDENTLFDSYGDGALKREAERLGFIVACPKGRDSASMYRGSAEQDVLDVLADVRRMYRVDASRIYLMGHSMGAYGTWSTAMNHPEIFAALGPISGGGSAAGMEKIRHIPEYVVHGDDDRTVPVTQSRTMVEAGKKAGAEIVYVEVPGGSHVSVAAPAFAGMLDFFARQKKADAK